MDVHNIAAFQNAFRCVTDHLEAVSLFVNYLYPKVQTEKRIVIVSPDAGGVKRADAMRQAMEKVLERPIEMAFFEKARAKGVLRTGRIVGEVKNATVIIIDDLISTGRTLSHAAKACKNQGATKVYAAATHGVFTSEGDEFLGGEELERILITDTIPPMRLQSNAVLQKLSVLPASELFADAIQRIHSNESIVELLMGS